MEKSYKWPHDKWSDEEQNSRHQQRQRTNTDEHRKPSKHDSSRFKKEYFEDENKSAGYQRNSYQKERHIKADIPRFAARVKCNSMQESRAVNSIEEQRLNAVENIKQSDYQDSHEEVSVGAHPFCSKKKSTYSDSNNQTYEDALSKLADLKMKPENRFSQTADAETELLSSRRNRSEICTNERQLPGNSDMNLIYSSHEGSLPVIQVGSTPSNDSSQFLENCNKQHYDQASLNIHDSVRNICTYEERSISQSVSMCTSSPETPFLNYSPSPERCKFNILKLTDLLYYNASLMQDRALFDFSTAIKSKILGIIDKFPYPEKEELGILCEITDGDQSEKNQQIITTRICNVVKKIIDKIPHVLNILDTPPLPPQILVYQTVPNLHGMANIPSNNYNFKIVQNSEVVLTSAADYNLMSDYKNPQNDKCFIPKTNLNFDNTCFNDHKESYKMQNFNINAVESTSPVYSSTSEDNTTVAGELSKDQCPASVGSRQYKPAQRSSLSKEDDYFASFELDQLITFNADAMHGDVVFEFGFSMKQKILEKIDWFEGLYKEKLKFLCELTDGSQREHNQKLINERMCDLIFDYKDEKEQSSKKKSSGKTKDMHIKLHNESKMLPEQKQNMDEELQTTHLKTLHDEVMHEHIQNLREEQSMRLHYDDKIKHEQRQNCSDEESRHSPPRILRDERAHEHRQYSLNKQSRNTYSMTLSDEVVHEHSQSASDEQSWNAQTTRSYESVHECRQTSNEQPRNTNLKMSRDNIYHEHRQSRNAYSSDEVVHEDRQSIVDGQFRHAHQERSHDVVHEHRPSRNAHSSDEVVYEDRQLKHAHRGRSYDTVHDHKQHMSDKQIRNTHHRRSYEVVYEDEQNISDEEPKVAHPRAWDEDRRNLDDTQPRKVHSRRLHSDDETMYEFRQNFSDVQSRNVHQRRSHYKEKTVHEHKQNSFDGQSRYVHQGKSHYREETVHEHKQNFVDGRSRNMHQRKLPYSKETVHEQHRQNFSDEQSRNAYPRRSQ